MVAPNPVFKKHLQQTWKGQAETFKRYRRLGNVFPEDLPPNQCDRIHAQILRVCEKRYGTDFWPDFFKEICKEKVRLANAAQLGDRDLIRNKRYQITIECFDRLPRIEFKNMLDKYQISLTTDVKSLHPEEPGWNRKFVP